MQPRPYEIGKMYSLDQIQPLVPQLKALSSRRAAIGLVHLYREKETQNYWIGGPLQGPDTNFFYYLGPQTSKERWLQSLGELFESIKRPTDEDLFRYGVREWARDKFLESLGFTFSSGSVFDFDFDFD